MINHHRWIDAIIGSTNFDTYFAFLLSEIDGDTAIRKLLAHSLLTYLFSELQGDRQCIAAVRILQQLNLKHKGLHMGDSLEVDHPLSTALIETIHDRPESEKSAQQASATLLATMARVKRPSEPVVWLADDTSVSTRPCTFPKHGVQMN